MSSNIEYHRVWVCIVFFSLITLSPVCNLSTDEETETINNQEMDTSTETTPSATITTTPATSTQTADDAPPPPYEPGDCPIPVETNSDEPPPMYTDIVKLPTYNESQNINNEEENESDNNRSIFLYWLQNQAQYEGENDDTLGSDVGFIFFFLLSFIFNWVGFLIAYCFTNTLSSQYGAITGFGLSLVKWAFIMKHGEYFQDSEVFMYILVLLGWVVFLRGMFSYIQLKRYKNSIRQEEVSSEFMG